MVRRKRSAALDSAVIDMYRECGTAAPVAKAFGVCDQTIYRILIENGIRRTKPKQLRVRRLSNCSTDICPALVMMLYGCGVIGKHIADIIGCSSNAIYRIVKHETGRRSAFCWHFRTCEQCGNEFKTIDANRRLCTKCFPHVRTANHRKRARLYGCEYVAGITVDKLVERDDNTCQICGGTCNIDDKAYGHFGPTYPTIDHIVPMSKGGGHTWENVQLAHARCNILKHDKAVNQNA